MSHAANFYVKKLKAGPGGAFTASERAVLWYLADGHNDENGGIAWPALPTIAEHCALSVRSIRRLIAGLEAKGIVARLLRTRKNGSYQSSLYYFVALGYDEALLKACGKVEGKAIRMVQKSVKKATPTMSPMTGYPDAHDRETLSPVSSLESLERESLVESPDSPLPPKGGESDDCEVLSPGEVFVSAATAKAEPNPVPNPVTGENWIAPPIATAPLLTPAGHWEAFKLELLRRLNCLPFTLRANAVDCYRQGIEHTELLEEELDEGGVEKVWTIGSSDPERTQGSLTLLRQNVLAALMATAKTKVQIRVFGAGGGEG